jgi:N-acetylneuraminic acid mutarotase
MDTQEVSAFDTKTRTWESLEPLERDFQMPNVAGVGNTLYVLGGLANKDAWAYDVAQREWSPRKPLPVTEGRGQAAVGVWGKKILIAGGILPGQSANNLNTGRRVSDVLAYDTVTDSWEKLPELSAPVGYCMGAVLGDTFWVMGGSTDFARTDEVKALDLKTRTWMNKPPLPLTLSSAGVGVIGRYVYLAGGVATMTGTIGPATWGLDPSTDSWLEVANMPTPRFAMGAAVIGDRLYVPTGIANGDTPAVPFKGVGTLEVYIPSF